MPALDVSRPRTLADAVLSRETTTRAWMRDALLILCFSAFVALCARIAVPLPFTPVPLTGQTLGVLLTGALLGSRRGALTLAVYLLEGLAGLPVFAPSATLPPGLGRLLGPTGGYLVAFIVAAGVVGLLAERGWDRRFGRAVLAMILGNLVIYAIAVSWLAVFTGSLPAAFAAGVLPFIPGDIVKIVLAALALPGGWALLRRARGGTGRR